MDRLTYKTDISAFSSENPDTIEFEVGALEAQFGSNPTALMTGGVVLRQGSKVAGADSARYDPDQRALFLEGAVRYEDSGTKIASDSAEFSYDFGRIRFAGAEFSLGSNNAHGAADALEVHERGRPELNGVS